MTEKIRIRPRNDSAHPGIDLWLGPDDPVVWTGWLAESLINSSSPNAFYKSTWELVPPPIPTAFGTVFEATVLGVNMRILVVKVRSNPAYVSEKAINGRYWHSPKDIDPDTVRILLEAPKAI